MENTGVVCCVCQCKHNMTGNRCDLPQIQVTNEKTGATSMADPHFCKSYQAKTINLKN